MKLTKDQRHTAYIIMLSEFNKMGDYSARLCHLVYKLFGFTNNGIEEKWHGEFFYLSDSNDSINRVLRHFPEIQSKEPELRWPDLDEKGKEFRIKLLKQCIEETANF